MSYRRNSYNSSGCQTPHAILIIMAALFICFPFGLALLTWDHLTGKQPQEAAQGCEDASSCFRRGLNFYQNGEYEKAALDWEKSCNYKDAAACANRGLLEYQGHLPEASPERMLEFADRGCKLNEPASCQIKAGILKKHFIDRPGVREQIRELYINSCSPELPPSCGMAAADFYARNEYEKAYEFAARGCTGDGSEKTAQACLYQALAAEKTGRSDPPREERIKTIREGCDRHERPYFCAVYALEITQDEQERLTYMDKACHFHGPADYCNAAQQMRRQVTGIEARLPELQKACSEDDRVACLRIGKYYETNNALSPRERQARAREVYEDLCQKRDRQGCAELRRLKNAFGR